MLSQKEFVEGCYNWYREADLQPGNPEDGDWDEAHYPVPKCKDGTETILLLKEHHAVQGVIQSEEMQHMCIFNWEKKYLTGEYLELFYKWKSEGMRAAHARHTLEQKILIAEKTSESMKVAIERQTPEQKILIAERKSESAKVGWARRTKEEVNLRREHQRSFLTSWWEEQTLEEKTQQSNKMKEGWARRRERQAQELLARWKEGCVRECIL